MPRQSRKLSKTGIYHVMMRGNERKDIFQDEEDKTRFIDTLFEKKKDNAFSLYAYCAMDNHTHLLIKEEKDPIARIIKRIGTSYAYYYNRKHKRVGHVFQDRFKSEEIKSDGQLLEVIRYIHNNPVKANIVKNALEYKWSSYNEYINQKNSAFETDEMLEIFTNDRNRAIKLFKEFTMERVNNSFIDCDEQEPDNEFMKEQVIDILNKSKANLEDIKTNRTVREGIILHLKFEKRYSVRQVAKLLDLNRNVVQRVKSE